MLSIIYMTDGMENYSYPDPHYRPVGGSISPTSWLSTAKKHYKEEEEELVVRGFSERNLKKSFVTDKS